MDQKNIVDKMTDGKGTRYAGLLADCGEHFCGRNLANTLVSATETNQTTFYHLNGTPALLLLCRY